MVGPRRPLLSKHRARNGHASRPAAAEFAALREAHAFEILAARFSIRLALAAQRQQEQAAIRQGFAHRFLLAAQEVCAARRGAALDALAREQEAALQKAQERRKAETALHINRHLAPIRARHHEEMKAFGKRRREPRR